MCGIFGYVGRSDPLAFCLSGLKRLEYRGYDSSGLAGIGLLDGIIHCWKEMGNLSFLEEKVKVTGKLPLSLAIGHTRWATHGKPSMVNAHPHLDPTSHIALVHNGIIENYGEIKQRLLKKGALFASETDTEVVCHLIASHYKGSLLEAVQKTTSEIRGSFAIAVIHKDHPEEIIVATRSMPLSIGYNDKESVISSDPNALLGGKYRVIFLADGEIAQVLSEEVMVYDQLLKPLMRKGDPLDVDEVAATKEGFDHFMQKEIFEQPITLQKALDVEEVAAFSPPPFSQVSIVGCGTSYHAGMIASVLLERLANIPSSAEIASEARYRPPLRMKETLCIAISQSGETADTLLALRHAKQHGAYVLGICNVKNSTLSREADDTLFLKAGPEISVCSTKAFTSQVMLFTKLSLHLAKARGLFFPSLEAELALIPEKVKEVLALTPLIRQMAKEYARYDDFFFMGRGLMYPTALESALKLKEISYLNANGYPGGELKHGPIALLSPTFPVIAFMGNEETFDKMESNLMEVKARGAPLLAFAPKNHPSVQEIADHTLFLPPVADLLAPILYAVAGQLFAYFVARERGADIDKPRNLAKSVTVE